MIKLDIEEFEQLSTIIKNVMERGQNAKKLKSLINCLIASEEMKRMKEEHRKMAIRLKMDDLI